MSIKYLTTRKIVGEHGSIKEYARKKKLPYQSVRMVISSLISSKKVEAQMRKNGYGETLDKDRIRKIKELKKNGNSK